ncbi:MAG TPA: hypothetical protein VK724_14330 [Bryobacteraceae bacterium]|nr:hypothetical protein [Bryobacteraceae bacterium]
MENSVRAPLYQRLRGRINAGIDGILSGSHWKLKALCAVAAIALFRAFPSYDALASDFHRGTWRDVQIKFDHPLIDTSRIFAPGSHESKLTYRLTVPILAHVLHLGETGLLILFGLSGFVLLYLILKVVFTLTGSKRAALFVCLAVACVWPGQAAFHELRGGYYDALALCLLVAACATSSSLLTAALIFLAAWTDERALIASSFVFLLRRGKAVAVVVAAAVYLGIRAYLTATISGVDVGGVGFVILSQQLNVIPLAIWTGLGGAWMLVFAGALAFVREKRYLAAAGFCGALALVIVVSMLVADTTRSMAYCLPAAFVALTALNPNRIEKLSAIAAAISVLVPSFYLEGSSGFFWLYPLPVQIARWLGF